MALTPQANSLSLITQIAGNPPRYPRNPTDQKRESLVLYIARVPGSRDVILTTMKPRLKNVTAEDVINSLYYLHVDMPSDVFLIEDMQVVKAAEHITVPPRKPIPQKSLPEGSVAQALLSSLQTIDKSREAETIPPLAPLGAPRLQTILEPLPLPKYPTQETINRKPPLPQRPPPEVENTLVRRPLGPRPYINRSEVRRKALPGIENTPITSGLQPRVHAAGLGAENLHAQGNSNNSTLNETKTLRQDSNSVPSISKPIVEESFSITLIRRDPTSGAQWNVGSICNESTLEDQESRNEPKPTSNRMCSSVSIKLTTLGYGQFRAFPVPQHIIGGSTSGPEPQRLPKILNSFDRQVYMVWSKSWERRYKQHRRASSDQIGAWKGARINNSADLGQYADGCQRDSSIYGVPESGFLSPWNGRCEFSIGARGRTLKCKHILANPTVTESPAALPIGASAPVSELRFNLPSSAALNASAISKSVNQENRRYSESKSDSSQSKLPPKVPKPKTSPARPETSNAAMYPSDEDMARPRIPITSYAAVYPNDDDDEDDPDDEVTLSLGREKAGGGTRGKRAKLGKLIVHDEGLKMLDLVVAANMGVWWTVWDR